MRRLLGLVGVAALVLALVPAFAPATSSASGHLPNDPLWDAQWGANTIRAHVAWQVSTGAGQRIAIVDSGLDLDHPDLASKIVGGTTFVDCPALPDGCGTGHWLDGEEDPNDADTRRSAKHGSHVAGIAAAATNNGIGIAGVARDAQLLSAKVTRFDPLLETSTASTADMAAAIRWSVRNGADAINLSLASIPGAQLVGGFGVVRAAVADAIAAGVVVVAAAGNEHLSVCGEPAFDPNVLCVVATGPFDEPAWYSNLAIDESMKAVAAPGGNGLLFCDWDIVSTVPAGTASFCGEGTPGYDWLAGTSMAAPHVAGVAALLKAQGRSVAQVVDAIVSTARNPDTGARGSYDPIYGYGIVDAGAAVAVPGADPGPDPGPDPDPSPQPSPDPGPDPDPPPPESEVVERHQGADRIATAAAISRRTHAAAAGVVVARADDYADALAGAPLAAHIGGPLLLTESHRLSPAAGAEVDRLGASQAFLLGGPDALSSRVADDLRARGVEVVRIWGPNRFATAAAIARVLPEYDEVFIAEGANPDRNRGWPDALSASGLAAALTRPVLLVTRDTLPDETADMLSRDVVATIVGGPVSVSAAVEAEVAARSAGTRRLAGDDRYATSMAVAREAEQRRMDAAITWLATGRGFADGLVAGASAGTLRGLLLLIDGHDLDRSPMARDFVAPRADDFEALLLAGGPVAISEETEARLRVMVE